MKRVKKGQFGYISYRRNLHLLLAVLMYVMAVCMYIAGINVTGDNKNLLTIVAVLSALPASQSLVTAILGFRAKRCTKELYDKIEAKITEGMTSLYDLYFTTYEKNYPISHLVMKENCLCALMNVSKHNPQDFEKYLEETFHKNNIKGVSVKIYENTQEEKYLRRLDELQKLDDEKSPLCDDTVRLIFDITY